MFLSEGILRYGVGFKVYLEIDPEIIRYYISLLPKYKIIQTQIHSAHITIVRTTKECPRNLSKWGNYEGLSVEFQYENIIKEDGLYYWLDAFSDDLNRIRLELGLGRYRLGFDRYHITLGNKKF